MIQGWESFMMTWLSRQQSLECSNFAHPFMLAMVRGLENMQHLIFAFGNSILCTK